MLIPSKRIILISEQPSLSRRVNANSQRMPDMCGDHSKLIKKGEC